MTTQDHQRRPLYATQISWSQEKRKFVLFKVFRAWLVEGDTWVLQTMDDLDYPTITLTRSKLSSSDLKESFKNLKMIYMVWTEIDGKVYYDPFAEHIGYHYSQNDHIAPFDRTLIEFDRIENENSVQESIQIVCLSWNDEKGRFDIEWIFLLYVGEKKWIYSSLDDEPPFDGDEILSSRVARSIITNSDDILLFALKKHKIIDTISSSRDFLGNLPWDEDFIDMDETDDEDEEDDDEEMTLLSERNNTASAA